MPQTHTWMAHLAEDRAEGATAVYSKTTRARAEVKDFTLQSTSQAQTREQFMDEKQEFNQEINPFISFKCSPFQIFPEYWVSSNYWCPDKITVILFDWIQAVYKTIVCLFSRLVLWDNLKPVISLLQIFFCQGLCYWSCLHVLRQHQYSAW